MKDIKDSVCAMPGGQCSNAACSGALKPIDHCCYDICGAIVHINTYG